MKQFIYLVLMVLISLIMIVGKAMELINLNWNIVLIPTVITIVSSLGFHIRESIKEK